MFDAYVNRRRRPTPHRLLGVRRREPAVALLPTLLLTLLPIVAAQPRTTPVAPYPDPPQVLFKDLFVAVQTEAIYADGKTFADAVPSAAPNDILAQYHAARPDSPEALKRFTDAHFALPAAAASAPVEAAVTKRCAKARRPRRSVCATSARFSSGCALR